MNRRRRELSHDPHRPRYHFLPPAGWMNDPNGFIHYHGVYHLFYQYNPAGAYHADIRWGHARSADLVHWEHRPIALTPTPGGADAGGCWSGSAIVAPDGTPLIFYSAVYPQTVCLATGSADLDTWTKHPANPLIGGPPPGFGGQSLDFRDPFVWRQGAWWYMVMGSRVEGGGGAVLLYRSADLLTWEYRGPLLLGDDPQPAASSMPTGTVWECPNLFPLDGRHVLLLSCQTHSTGDLLCVGYATGDFSNERFTPESFHLLEHGDALYAPQVTIDEHGRCILFGWLRERRDSTAQRTAGWSGIMSLPRVLSLGPDGELRRQPAPELAQLRGASVHIGERLLRPGDANPLAGVWGDCLEIAAELAPEGAAPFGLRLRRSPAREEETTLRIDPAAGTIAFDVSRSGGGERPDGPAAAAWVAPLPAERPLRLRVFLDRSVVEAFVNDRVTLSTRVYPTRPDSLGVELFTEDGPLRVTSLDVWEMEGIRADDTR